jgi:YegS/Rv2252/BmrU family lipid kinase
VSDAEYLPAQADHVLICVNPTAGSGSRRRQQRVRQFEEMLVQAGLTVDIHSDLDPLCRRSGQLHSEGRLRVVVGAGGDGTLHGLLNGLGAGIPLAMLPLGTENLLAQYVAQGRGLSALVRMIQTGRVVRLDAGRANGRLFLLMATAGFDADVARRLSQQRAGNIRRASYIAPILSAIRNYEYPYLQITLETSDETRCWQACWCFTFNLPQYGFGMRFVPDANPSDGQLDVCTFRHGSFWNAVWYTANLYLRRHTRLDDCVTGTGRRITVEADTPVPYELDGDFSGWLPLELDVVPNRLTLLMPAGDIGSAPRLTRS